VKANYAVVNRTETFLVIKDVGPWDVYMTVTNAAEAVVADLLGTGDLRAGQRLLYYDSEEQLDEILIDGGRFAGFRPVGRGRFS
jgi:hypothetical protein